MWPWTWLRSLLRSLRSLWRRLWDGSGFDVEELARRLGVPAQQLEELRPSYQRKGIPKRSGGQRILSVPADDLKAMQRRILRRLLRRLRTHPAAKGFQPGESIVTNALPHVGRAVVVRLDMKDFFPSTSAARVYAYFRKIGWNRPAANVLTRLCTHEGGLPQGAPTSPRLSNLVNYRLDARIASMAAKVGANYTRYADDITLSLEDDRRLVRYLIRFVKRVALEQGYRLHSRKKLRIRRQHQQQQVTGLVVNAGIRLPRRIRRWLRAVEHHHASGRPATLTQRQLAGWRALESMITQQAGALAQAPAASPPRLHGTWVMAAVEHDGQKAPTYGAQEGPDPVVWIFDKDEVRVIQGGREKRAAYVLDIAAEPHSISITPKTGAADERPVVGIYEERQGELLICLSEPGRDKPASFATVAGSGQTLFRLRPAPAP